VTHRPVQTNGISTHITEAGTGPLLLLVHGFPELSYSWRHQLPVLAEAGYHAVAPDLRGYGETDISQADDGYAVSNQVADPVGLLDALAVEHAVLVAHLVPRLFRDKAGAADVVEGMPELDELPPWLSQDDLDQYAAA
jgi:pimeloyl-ACP methyl ester carboxylesterase